jgi:Na+-driven multidrug efflux pump
LNIAKIALPTLTTFILQGLAEVINTCFIGRYMSEKNPRILAGAGMGNIVITMMCVAVFQGMNGALETLISQAIGAATQNGG